MNTENTNTENTSAYINEIIWADDTNDIYFYPATIEGYTEKPPKYIVLFFNGRRQALESNETQPFQNIPISVEYQDDNDEWIKGGSIESVDMNNHTVEINIKKENVSKSFSKIRTNYFPSKHK